MIELVGRLPGAGQVSGRILAPPQIIGKITATGAAGKSAYQYAVEGGYTATEQQFYIDLAYMGNGSSGLLYDGAFAAEDFVRSGVRYYYRVPASVHQFGYSVAAREVLRELDGGYGNILYQYHVLANGDVVVYSAEPFAGKIIIEKI